MQATSQALLPLRQMGYDSCAEADASAVEPRLRPHIMPRHPSPCAWMCLQVSPSLRNFLPQRRELLPHLWGPWPVSGEGTATASPPPCLPPSSPVHSAPRWTHSQARGFNIPIHVCFRSPRLQPQPKIRWWGGGGVRGTQTQPSGRGGVQSSCLLRCGWGLHH